MKLPFSGGVAIVRWVSVASGNRLPFGGNVLGVSRPGEGSAEQRRRKGPRSGISSTSPFSRNSRGEGIFLIF